MDESKTRDRNAIVNDLLADAAILRAEASDPATNFEWWRVVSAAVEMESAAARLRNVESAREHRERGATK